MQTKAPSKCLILLLAASIILVGSIVFGVHQRQQGSLYWRQVTNQLQAKVNTLIDRETNLDLISHILNNYLTFLARGNYSWSCDFQQRTPLDTKGGNGANWLSMRCEGTFPRGYMAKAGDSTGPLSINIIDVNLNNPHIRVLPVLAHSHDRNHPNNETILTMGQERPKIIAGINGGYYFRNYKKFHDTSCLWKSFPQVGTQNIGNSLLVINGKTYAKNCYALKVHGPARSALLETKDHQFKISEVMPNAVPKGILNAIGAGPGLIDNSLGKPRINISWQYIPSTIEFSANTALALGHDRLGHQHMLFIEVDGSDGDKGMYSFEMANFIAHAIPQFLDIKVMQAMGLDQGHSTQLYVKDKQGGRIVSQARTNKGVRSIFDGLFIEMR